MIGDNRVRFGSFQADLGTGELFRSGKRVLLQEKPFQILALLLQNPRQLVTRQEIISKVWPDVSVEDDFCLNTAMHRLRSVLNHADPKTELIETVGRRGYRLLSDVGHPTMAVPGEADVRLVVLPFTNLIDGSRDLFSDGLTAQMIVQLGHAYKNVSVISPLSSLHFSGEKKSLSHVVRRLQPDYLLLGTVCQASSRIRVSARLLRADQCCIWSESYTKTESDIFQVQDEITRSISEGLRQVLPQPSATRASLVTSPSAYEKYLKAKFFSFKFSQATFKKALQLFEEVIVEDPKFVHAHAALAHMLTAAVTYGGPPHRVLYERIELLAATALGLCDEIPDAHCALGWLRCWQGDWVASERAFLRAIGINPSFALPYTGYARLSSVLGHHEQAIEAGKRARDLDPLSPIVHTMLALELYFAGRMQEAITCLEEALEIDPGFGPAHGTLGFVYYSLGELERSVLSLRSAADHGEETPLMRSFLAWSLAATGQKKEASTILSDLLQLRKTNCLPATSISLIYAELGNKDQAWTWLETAMNELDPWRTHLAIDPRFKPFWRDSRFPSLMKNLGLPFDSEKTSQPQLSVAVCPGVSPHRPMPGDVNHNRIGSTLPAALPDYDV